MRTVVLYAILVGLPIAGTSLVLESGRNSQAPPAIKGIWTIQTSGDSTVTGCTAFVVGQSGDHLTISLGESGSAIIFGRLGWGRTDRPGIAIIATQEAANRADGAALVSITANVDLTSAPLAMEGTLTAPACAAGRAVAFRATLRPANASIGGRQ